MILERSLESHHEYKVCVKLKKYGHCDENKILHNNETSHTILPVLKKVVRLIKSHNLNSKIR